MTEQEPIDPTNADSAPETVPFEDASIEAQLAAALAERDEYYSTSLRAQADLENYRRRVQKERTDDARYSSARMARDLLPAIDNLDRAIEAAAQSDDIANLVEGIRLVAKQLHGVLDGHQIKPIPTENQPFDPNLHEALTQVPSPDHPPMTIVQEVERGYLLHDRVLRPAKVIVSSGPAVE